MTRPDPARVMAIFSAVIARPAAERAGALVEQCGDDDALRRAVERMLAADDAPPAFLDDDRLADAAADRARRVADDGPESDPASEIEAILDDAATRMTPAPDDAPYGRAAPTPWIERTQALGARGERSERMERPERPGRPGRSSRSAPPAQAAPSDRTETGSASGDPRPPEPGGETERSGDGPADRTSAMPGSGEAVPPRRIAGFEVVRLLGEGGMGTVYEARQLRPRRTVALKLVRAAATSAEGARRFEIEVQALGRLRHPGIATLLEVGAIESEAGRLPWIAMEFVPGAQPITASATARALDQSARLRLLAAVCDAVHHGHQRGVIHRDLKPDNVLVGEDGSPKVIDFGVARAADPEGTIAASRTASGQWIGTPRYMSPEQCDGRTLDIDVRTDVYALGVLAYEVLTGDVPYEPQRSVMGLARAIMEDPPIPPGRRNPALRGDVEAVLLRALEKEPDRRYQSAAELADELRRIVTGEPVAALRHARWYVVRRWVRRHRRRLTAATVAFVLITALGAVALTAQRQSARSRRYQEYAQLLARADEISDPFSELGVPVESVAFVANALDDAPGELSPSQAASLRILLGRAHLDRGEWEEAEAHLEVALATRERLRVGPEQLSEALHELGRARYWTRDLDSAAALYGRAAEIRRRDPGPRSPAYANTVNDLGATAAAQGRWDDAIAHYTEALSIRREVLGNDSPWTAATANNFAATVLRPLGRTDDALPLFRDAIVTLRRGHGTDAARNARLDRYLLLALPNYAWCQVQEGDPEAARLSLDAAEALVRTRPEGAPEHATIDLVVAEWALSVGQANDALARARSGLDARRARRPAGSRSVVDAQLVVARMLLASGEAREALALADDAVAVRFAEDAPPTPGLALDRAEALVVRASVLLALGELDDACDDLARTADLLPEAVVARHWVVRRMVELQKSCPDSNPDGVG